MFLLVRWPLLFLLGLFIFVVFGAYVGTRQCVNAWERLFAWRGQKGKLRKNLRGARSYKEWREAAEVMDEYLQFDAWKAADEDAYYDWRLVKKVRRSLKSFREKGDVRSLIGVLNTCLRANFAGTESSRLYSETFYGTKNLIESYLEEVQTCLEYVRNSPQLSLEEKRQFLKSANTNFGSSALCLSGGASFGYYHFGVVKAFVDADLLPRVIAGTSAGGLVASLVCTRTDEELKRLLTPRLADNLTACEDPFRVWFERFWKTGARFDTVQWARKCCFFTRGSLTFRDAWLRTGRVLNISVIPFDQHSPTKLLNYLTAPDTVIWSALLASAAVPGILNPVILMQKTPSGSIIPWSWGTRFKDGSLRVDIPVQALNLYFNVTHPIVSQVNPHVHLFFFAPKGSPGKPVAHSRGKGWRGGFLLSAAEQWLKLELTKNFRFIRDLELLPRILGQDWSSVFLQRFDGTVTIWPRTRVMDWFHILSDPDRQELERMMRVGQIVTWPKLHMIENRFRIEREILRGRQEVRKALQRDRPGPDTEDARSFGRVTPVLGQPWSHSGVEELPIESEAERDFAKGAQRFFKKSRKSPGTSPLLIGDEAKANSKKAPLLNHPTRRRQESYFGDGTADDEGGAGNAAGPLDLQMSPPETPFDGPKKTPPYTFLSRLRNRSFPGFSSPFSNATSEGKKGSSVVGESVNDEEWSSDSSSDLGFASGPLSANVEGSSSYMSSDANALALSIGTDTHVANELWNADSRDEEPQQDV
ncbi:patatin-domain-containing protein [Sistotremastrum niveocremeum HHB9708]|uniref:Patatin-like phospholipase domain-containing protein n=1 Tax=Sistotremastrum niveocremeum HHB9708 TaxID=1314777 RepID=A0A164ZGD2_9AGAM|nr:patatin-domain-containing protein [Sistotremastrum niveocremeum HHB9708]